MHKIFIYQTVVRTTIILHDMNLILVGGSRLNAPLFVLICSACFLHPHFMFCRQQTGVLSNLLVHQNTWQSMKLILYTEIKQLIPDAILSTSCVGDTTSSDALPPVFSFFWTFSSTSFSTENDSAGEGSLPLLSGCINAEGAGGSRKLTDGSRNLTKERSFPANWSADFW